jgi:hypothetical protein
MSCVTQDCMSKFIYNMYIIACKLNEFLFQSNTYDILIVYKLNKALISCRLYTETQSAIQRLLPTLAYAYRDLYTNPRRFRFGVTALVTCTHNMSCRYAVKKTLSFERVFSNSIQMCPRLRNNTALSVCKRCQSIAVSL